MDFRKPQYLTSKGFSRVRRGSGLGPKSIKVPSRDSLPKIPTGQITPQTGLKKVQISEEAAKQIAMVIRTMLRSK